MKRQHKPMKLSLPKGIDGIIRLPIGEYPSLEVGDTYTHFNLANSGHKVGKTYLLVKIIKNGTYTKEKELFPEIDMTQCDYGECTFIENNVKYDNLPENIFKHSAKHIQTTNELKKIILTRYSKSMPELTKEELLAAGVGITTIKIKGKR